ncbi:DUF3098 domain-containing protein [Rubricoccus marinus]|uniref:DUF3098 domain-containing protein n=1 Tax=Rubricoccus marinus TaxID=716817 RepID=A0A259U218_9BACT|nr:DUF3098 domain-containing protein [Rubricoccus marinus]OZC03854.1 hypothetical protein BSZ36_13185 [Rubricoccus marinus]
MAKRSSKKRATKTAPAARRGPRSARMPFERRNYVLLLGAIALIVVGYVLMLVDNAVSDNPVDSALSLTVAPLLLLGGYLGVIWAVLSGVQTPEASGADASDATPAEA